MAHRVDIPYVAPVAYRAGRQRLSREAEVRGSVAVEIEEIGADGVRVAAHGSYVPAWGRDRERFRVPSRHGRSMTPLRHRSGSGRGEMDLAAFRERVGTVSDGRLTTGAVPPGEELPRDVREILFDGRPGMEGRIRAAAADYAVLDGAVVRVGAEPVHLLGRYGAAGLVLCFDPDPLSAMDGYAFRLDRRAAALEAFGEACRPGLYKVERSFGAEDEIEVADPRLLTFREDVHNAAVAAREALRRVGENLAAMDPDAILSLHALAAARAGLADGGATPEDVDAALERVDGDRRRLPFRTNHLGNFLALGREMIARSLPSDRPARIDADDAEAIRGMSPG